MARKKTSPAGLKRLDEFLTLARTPAPQRKRQIEAQRRISRQRVGSGQTRLDLFLAQSASEESPTPGAEIDKVLEILGQGVREPTVGKEELKPPEPKVKIPEDLMEKLLELPVGPDRGIRCDATGECSDGKRLTEIFIDGYGIRRQRSFIRTSRTPIIVDWVVEEGKIEKVLERAYKVVTDRGAMALVPRDFLCDLVKRYGVLIDGVDCSNYQINLTESRRKR